MFVRQEQSWIVSGRVSLENCLLHPPSCGPSAQTSWAPRKMQRLRREDLSGSSRQVSCCQAIGGWHSTSARLPVIKNSRQQQVLAKYRSVRTRVCFLMKLQNNVATSDSSLVIRHKAEHSCNSSPDFHH